jgi:hypothetical protein
MPTSINFKKDTDSLVSSSTPGLSSIAVDMSMTETQKDEELDAIKRHVKRSVFRIWKFYHKDPHSKYSDNERTMCGLLMKCMKKKEPESWWKEIRGFAVTALTNQRNNCIKSINTKYKGKYKQIPLPPNRMPLTKTPFPLPKPTNLMEAFLYFSQASLTLTGFWRCAKISVSTLRSLTSLLHALFFPNIGTMITK